MFHLLSSNLRLETQSALALKSRECAVQNQMQASGSSFIPERKSSRQKEDDLRVLTDHHHRLRHLDSNHLPANEAKRSEAGAAYIL